MPTAAERGALSARSFWSARFSRLYPVYAFSLLLSAGMLLQEVHAHTKLDFGLGVILTPLLLQGWHPVLSTFWNTPAWTMSTEAFFLSIVPVVNHAPAATPSEDHAGNPVRCVALRLSPANALHPFQSGR